MSVMVTLNTVKRVVFLLYVTISIGLFTSPLAARTFSERSEWGVLTHSLGGASASMAGGLDSFSGNPATLGYFSGARGLGGNYQMLPHDLDSWSVAVIDGTNAITGGFQFQWTEAGDPRRLSYGSTIAYRRDWAWFGATVRAVNDSKVPTGKGWHLLNSAGALFLTPGGLSLGVYGKNYLDREPDSEFPPSLYAGLTYTVPNTAKLTAETSRHFEIPDQDWNFSYGGEFLFREYYLLRGGYFWSRSNGEETFWSIGAGMQAQKIDMLFAFTQTRENSKAGYSFEMNFKF